MRPDFARGPLCHGLPAPVAEREPDEHLDVRILPRDGQRLLGVGRLLRVVTPCGSPGFVSWPYSVIQTGTVRWNHFFRSASNLGSVEGSRSGSAPSERLQIGDVGYG